MDHSTGTTVARQATFDTDPDRAKIKKGTLKLPVIRSEDDTQIASDQKHKSKEKSTGDIKSGGDTKPSENSKGTATKDKHGKDSLNQHRKSDTFTANAASDTKDTDVSEKQKKLNALNNAHKHDNKHTKEPEDSRKEPTQPSNKALALKHLNAKRTNSPEKRQDPPKSTENKEDNSISSKLNKKHNNHAASNLTSVKHNTSDQIKENNQNKTSRKEDKKDSEEKTPATTKHEEIKDSKSLEKRSRSPNKKLSVTSSSSKDNTEEHSGKSHETSSTKPKIGKGDKSPNKRVSSPQKQLSSTEADSLKALKAKKQIAKTEGSSKTETDTRTEERVSKRELSPEKKLDSAKKSPKEQKDLKTQLKDNKDTGTINDKLNQTPVQAPNNTFTSGKPPVGTKLSDNKKSGIVKIKHRPDEKEIVSLKDIPDEKEHAELTTAVALLVSEGSKHSDKSEDKRNKDTNHVKRDSAKDNINSQQNQVVKSGNTETNTSISEINERADNLPELKDSKGQETERIYHSVKNEKVKGKESVRQTYVVSPSPTKLNQQGENKPDLVVEQIDIEARPKLPKMAAKESYEQVYAERNTLLKAEYTFRKRIKQLEDEANGFLRTIEDLTSENSLLRERVDHLERKQRHDGDDSAYEQISVLEKEKGKLEGRVKQLEHLVNSNVNASENTDAMQKEIRELKAQVIKLQTENQTVNEENIKLKAENYENVKKLHSIEAEASSLAKSVTAVESEKLDKIKNLKDEQSRSNKDKLDMKKRNEELEKKVGTLEYENKSLSESLEQKKNELKELMTVMKDENKFDDEIKDLKNQILKLQKEKKDMELEHAKELRTVTSDLRETKERLDDTSKEIYELKIKFDETEKENVHLKDENKTLEKVKQSQEEEIEKLKAEIERLKKLLREANDKYNKVVTDNATTSTELRQAKENAEELNKDLQKMVADKESQISKLIAQLDVSNKDKDFVSQTLKKEKEQLTNENNRLKVFETNMGRMESEMKHLVTKYEETQLKNKQLSIQLQDKGFEISNFEQQIFEMNMKLDNSSKRVNQLDKEKRELEEDRREWEVKKEKVNDIEASNKRLTEENRRLRSQLEVTSYSMDYKTSEPERERSERSDSNRPVIEAWSSDVSVKPTQQAFYVQREKKKVTIAPHPTMAKKVPFSKAKSVKTAKHVSQKKDERKNSLRSSRSLEDLRKTPDRRTPDSEASLPELQKETRLTTTYGGFGTGLGYSQIHKNRIRHLNKKVY